MKPYLLVINIILKSGKERKYTNFTPQALTKEEAEQGAEQLKELIESIYKDEIIGTISLKVSLGKEVLINTNELSNLRGFKPHLTGLNPYAVWS